MERRKGKERQIKSRKMKRKNQNKIGEVFS